MAACKNCRGAGIVGVFFTRICKWCNGTGRA
jgi:DnaJ-class molecular chaperone